MMRRMFQVLSVTGALLTAVAAEAQQTTAPPTSDARGTNRWNAGARFGLGLGSYSNVIDENCPELTGDFNLSCDGDDSGPTWMAGLDLRWLATDRFDIGLRGGMTRLPKITLEAAGTFEGIDISATAEGSGSLWTIGPEAGFRATPRVRVYGGAGLSPFTFDSTLTLSALGLSEREEQENSGLGRSAWGGVEWTFRDRWSLFGEGARTWLKDDDVAEDEEPFDVAFTAWIVGVRWSFGR